MRLRRLVGVVTLGVVIAGLGAAQPARSTPTDVFFSEYVEGTSFNKALEIFNGTGAPVNLLSGNYRIEMYFNGSSSVGLSFSLIGTVADGDVFVVAPTNAGPAILAQADQTFGTAWFNGDDAVVLKKGVSTIVDVIGQIGSDPGTEWGTGLASTADNTLRRKPTVGAGDANGSDAFDPAVEWDGFATDTFDGLGAHQFGTLVIATCGGPLSTAQGAATSRQVSASDVDGTVIDIAITSVTPSPSPGTISLGNLTPAASVGGTATATVTVDAAVPLGTYAVLVTATNNDATPQTGTCSPTVNVVSLVPIHDIQGAGHISPVAGDRLSTQGIVTAVRANGFFLQDPGPDADDSTSEAIFVFTGSLPAVSVGDGTLVTGTVSEFRPGGSASTNLTTTELTSPTTTVLSTGNPLPAATVIGNGGRVPPSTVIEDDAAGSVETSGVFDPSTDGIDFYESLEAMLVQVNNPVAVGPRNAFGEIAVVGDNGAGASVRTTRGGIVIRSTDFNPERIILDDVLTSTPIVDTGDSFSAAAVGVLDYSFGNFKLLTTSALSGASAGLARETAASAGTGELSFATFNVENLDPADGPAKFDELAGLIVNNLRSPDLLSLEEVQDNTGPVNDGVVDATTTYDTLITAIQAAGGPSYVFRQIDPVDNQDGGEPGGNIRVGFLFRTDRGLSFVDRAGGGSTTATSILNVAGSPQLSASPGRIDPTNGAFNSSRKPLAGEFAYNGRTLFVIANHWNSKGGDNPLLGRFQPPTLVSETQRTQQAQVVNGFVDSILAVDPNAAVVVLGDLNDFWFSNPLQTLTGSPAVLSDLITTLPQAERYTFVFDGNSQDLDHLLVSAGFAGAVTLFDAVHVNAEFAVQASDHDPLVAQICADVTPPSLSVTVSPTTLFSPNHKYVTVNAAVSATDTVDPSPSVTLVSVTSNEPDNAPGGADGNTVNDIVVDSDTSFRLRAERSETGTGRVYTVTYRATDACGNSTVRSATVTVPVRS